MPPRKTLAAAMPLGSMYDTTSPGSIPWVESSAASARAVERNPAHVSRVSGSGARSKADRMPGSLVAQQPLGERGRGGEALGAIERQYRRQLFSGERVFGTDAILADDQELRRAQRRPVERRPRSDRACSLRDV